MKNDNVNDSKLPISEEWMYDDAIYLRESGRKRGCLCLLLCLVDALAKRLYPEEKNRVRYVSYLKDKLKDIGIDRKTRIEEKGKLLHFSEIIYEYFRCNFIHEADSRENEKYEVQLEYEQPKGFKFNGVTLLDRVNKKYIIKSDYLINLLIEIINSERGRCTTIKN